MESIDFGKRDRLARKKNKEQQIVPNNVKWKGLGQITQTFDVGGGGSNKRWGMKLKQCLREIHM